MSKKKITLQKGMDVDALLERISKAYRNEKISTVDGVKIDFQEAWVHLRKSNTEPIIRVYTEAKSESVASSLADRFIEEIKQLL